MRTKRAIAEACGALLAAPLLTLAGTNAVHATQQPGATVAYEVTYTNATSGQYLTPPNWAAHSSAVDVFERGRPASPGVEAVAELGGVPLLAEELANAVDAQGLGVSGVGGDGPLAPGESVSFEIESSERRFSLVSMIICTNDGFGGVDSVWLPTTPGRTATYSVRAYDAGTELNTENRVDVVPAPFCGEGEGSGVDQPDIDGFGRINFHPTLRGVGDLPSTFDWRGPVATVSITPVAQPSNYSVEFENITSGQYMTPPNWAAHTRAVDVFQRGQAASPGVEAVAELGGVPVLAAELQGAVDDAGLGVSGVGMSEGPLAPGATATADFTTDADRLSIVSMVICTNDGFGGLDSKRLPRVGQTRTYYLWAYDAGTELNTENRADIVPAPFCGEGEGSGVDQPEIDGFGRINFHPTLRGVGDLPDTFDWRGPVMKVTVTNNG